MKPGDLMELMELVELMKLMRPSLFAIYFSNSTLFHCLRMSFGPLSPNVFDRFTCKTTRANA